MQKNKTEFLIFLLGWLMMLSSAQAASFDCAKASTKVEHIICDNPEISRLDEKLSLLYKTIVQDKQQANSVKREQKQWIRVRNGCLDAGCVRNSYETQLSRLNALLSGNNANKKRLSAGWDYKQEGGGMGTEPYTIGGDDVMCQQVKAYMNRVAPNWKPYKEGAAYLENYCTSAVRLFPGFTEPPWVELDPHKHKELIVRLLRYRAEGARAYWGFEKPSLPRSDKYYRDEAYRFIESGGRLQYWKTRLLDFATDPKDFVEKPLPLGDQHVIQLRFAIDYSTDERFQNQPCHLPGWTGAVFLVTEDLSGPMPHVFDSVATGLPSSSLLMYGGKRILLDDSGYEIRIGRERETGNDFIGVCTLIYPFY